MKQVQEQNIDEVEGQEVQAGARAPMKVQDPVLPTQAEIDEHMTTHLPYRSWCRFCIRGCGKAADHKQQDKVEHIVPEFHMD